MVINGSGDSGEMISNNSKMSGTVAFILVIVAIFSLYLGIFLADLGIGGKVFFSSLGILISILIAWLYSQGNLTGDILDAVILGIAGFLCLTWSLVNVGTWEDQTAPQVCAISGVLLSVLSLAIFKNVEEIAEEKAVEKKAVVKRAAEKKAAATRRRRRKQIEASKVAEEEKLAKKAEAIAKKKREQRKKKREQRKQEREESKKLEAFTPQAYLEKLIPDLDHSNSEIRLNTVYKMGVEDTPLTRVAMENYGYYGQEVQIPTRTFADSYYSQFPLYYLEQKVKELGLQAQYNKDKKAAIKENEGIQDMIDSGTKMTKVLEEAKIRISQVLVVERLKKAKWRFRTESINDVEDAENSPKNLRKFMNSDDPALRKMGLSMAKGADLIIGLDDLKKEINEELAGKLRDKNRRVRSAAAIALGAIGDSRAIPGLQEASGHVRRDVEKASPHLNPHRYPGVKSYAGQWRSRMIAERKELIMDLLEKIEEENWVP